MKNGHVPKAFARELIQLLKEITAASSVAMSESLEESNLIGEKMWEKMHQQFERIRGNRGDTCEFTWADMRLVLCRHLQVIAEELGK